MGTERQAAPVTPRSAPPPFLRASALLAGGSKLSFWIMLSHGFQEVRVPFAHSLPCVTGCRNSWRKEVKFGYRSEFPSSSRKACVDKSCPFLSYKCQGLAGTAGWRPAQLMSHRKGHWLP